MITKKPEEWYNSACSDVIMYDCLAHAAPQEPDWRHTETFENRVLVAHRYMHCELESQQRSLESQKSMAPAWIPESANSMYQGQGQQTSHNSSFLL